MSDLPELPKPAHRGEQMHDFPPSLFTADQMRAYGAACAAHERERCAKLIEPTNPPEDWTEYAKIKAQCAAAIRAGEPS